MMGQQQPEQMVAEQQQAGGALRRIVLTLAMVAVMAALMVASAMPAFAKPPAWYVGCQDADSAFGIHRSSPKGGAFGDANKDAAQQIGGGDYRGNECQRGPVR